MGNNYKHRWKYRKKKVCTILIILKSVFVNFGMSTLIFPAQPEIS